MRLNPALATIASDIDTTKIIHVYDKINDITYRFVPYERFKKFIADEASHGGDPWIFTIYAGNLIVFPTPEFEPITGTADGTTTDKLVDSTASFTSDGTTVGMIVSNTTDGTKALITAIDDDGTLSIDSDIFISGEKYSISFAIHMAYVKLLLDGIDSATTILVPDKYKNVIIDNMMIRAVRIDPELGNIADIKQDAFDSISRMIKDNADMIAEITQPESHRGKYHRRHDRHGRDVHHGFFPLGRDNI